MIDFGTLFGYPLEPLWRLGWCLGNLLGCLRDLLSCGRLYKDFQGQGSAAWASGAQGKCHLARIGIKNRWETDIGPKLCFPGPLGEGSY